MSFKLKTMGSTASTTALETTMPMEDKKRYFREYQQDIRNFIADYDARTGHSNTLNNALEELAFFPNAYALFDTAEEKIDYIFRLVVARHCTAFLHSLMVSAFAEAILSAIIDKEPALMVGYHGMTSPDRRFALSTGHCLTENHADAHFSVAGQEFSFVIAE